MSTPWMDVHPTATTLLLCPLLCCLWAPGQGLSQLQPQLWGQLLVVRLSMPLPALTLWIQHQAEE